MRTALMPHDERLMGGRRVSAGARAGGLSRRFAKPATGLFRGRR